MHYRKPEHARCLPAFHPGGTARRCRTGHSGNCAGKPHASCRSCARGDVALAGDGRKRLSDQQLPQPGAASGTSPPRQRCAARLRSGCDRGDKASGALGAGNCGVSGGFGCRWSKLCSLLHRVKQTDGDRLDSDTASRRNGTSHRADHSADTGKPCGNGGTVCSGVSGDTGAERRRNTSQPRGFPPGRQPVPESISTDSPEIMPLRRFLSRRCSHETCSPICHRCWQSWSRSGKPQGVSV